MKLKNLFVMSLAALSLAACSNDDEVAVPETGDVVVNLSSIAQITKADNFTEDALKSLDAEKAIAAGSLYVYEGNTFITKVAITGESVEIPKLTVGNTYNFVAVVNPGDNAITATTKEDLRKAVIKLSTKESGHFVMFGETMNNPSGSQEVTVKKGESNSLTVNVKRVLSGVQLVTVKTNFDENVPLFAREGKGVVTSLELLGTNPTSALNGALIEGSPKIDGIAANFGAGINFDNKTTGNVAVTAEDNSVRAYCCPGKVEYAVLYVTYTYEKVEYKRAYNVTVLKAKDLEANTLYGLNVTLTGAGSDDGGEPDEFETATANLSVADWSNGTIIDVDQEN